MHLDVLLCSCWCRSEQALGHWRVQQLLELSMMIIVISDVVPLVKR
jgi:hypothetical protein